MLKIVDNSDKDLLEEAERQLKENKEKYGKRYCPCSMERTNDYVCPCKPFREQSIVGECHCGRYMKINA